MSNYSVITDWDGKDALADSNPAKVISGDEFQDEFDAISTAVSTKADINGNASEAFSASSLTLGGTAITSTAAELNILDGVTATATELNLLDGITAINDEDDMTSDSDTSLATQQSIKAYVDAQVAAATMTWTYITRTSLKDPITTSYSTVSMPSSVTSANPSAIILSFQVSTGSTETASIYMKSSLVSERVVAYSYSPNNSDDASGSFNTITVPYTSSIDVKVVYSNGIDSAKCWVDGYIS